MAGNGARALNLQELGPEGIGFCVKSTPRKFRFTVTQHLELEHNWERVVSGLQVSIKPLSCADKLGAVVVDLPNWFQLRGVVTETTCRPL